MSPTKKVVYDANTGYVSVHGIKHNTLQLMDQAVDGVCYDPDQGVFRFRDDAFNRDWLRYEKVQLVVKQ